jgi:pyruvate dehydrogenase E2 component (dihydrolipoamide acetyltransferase)
MAIELKMPALSPTMEKGTLAKWLVAEGDLVRVGDVVAEIETDKATMELEATDDGRVARLMITEGTDDVPVGTVIALLAEARKEEADGETNVPVLEEAPLLKEDSLPAPAAAEAVPLRLPPEEVRIAPRTTLPSVDRMSVSPLARRLAEASKIDLSSIAGSGPNGRILLADLGIRSPIALAGHQTPAVQPVAAILAPPAGVPVETVKLSSMSGAVGPRRFESAWSASHFYLTARCRLDQLTQLRAEVNASLAARGIEIGINDMLIKALALALREVPGANVQFGGDVLHRFGRADIAMAVAIDGGWATPVIRDTGALSLSAIAMASRALTIKAREGRLAPDDCEGGTASISNLGMFGIDEMVPISNPPHALVLGVAAGIEQPWKVDGTIALATIMSATAGFDQRAIDGLVAAQFMNAFRDFVEVPLLLCG